MSRPVVTTALPLHRHGDSFHDHDWNPALPHSHGGTMQQDSEPVDEEIRSGKPRDYSPWVHHDRKGAVLVRDFKAEANEAARRHKARP